MESCQSFFYILRTLLCYVHMDRPNRGDILISWGLFVLQIPRGKKKFCHDLNFRQSIMKRNSKHSYLEFENFRYKPI